MSASSASKRNEPTPRLAALYRRWGVSGAGLLITVLDFVERVRSQTAVPLMLTGGFRTPDATACAVSSGAVDVVGLARPMIWSPGLPADLLRGPHLRTVVPVPCAAAPRRLALLAGAADITWHTEAMRCLSTGHRSCPRRVPAALVRCTARTVCDSGVRRLMR